MINNQRVYIECFEGNKIDEMISIIREFQKRDFDIHIYYKYSLKKYSDQFNIKSINQHFVRNEDLLDKLYTAKYIILNTNIFRENKLKKRDGQILVQLWHGVPFKKINNDIVNLNENQQEYVNNFNYELSQTDYLLIPNDFCKEVFSKAFVLPKNIKFLEFGYPRNDVLFEEYDTKKLKEKYGIPTNKKIVAYCPTFDDKTVWGTYNFKQNVAKVVENMSENYHFVFSFHPGTTKYLNFEPKTSNFIINKEGTIPLTELFIIADTLITDFSSTMFDFAITNKPVINFFDKEQYDNYITSRGSYFDMYTEHFNIAENIEQLEDMIAKMGNLTNKWQEKYAPKATNNAANEVLKVLEIKKHTKNLACYIAGNAVNNDEKFYATSWITFAEFKKFHPDLKTDLFFISEHVPENWIKKFNELNINIVKIEEIYSAVKYKYEIDIAKLMNLGEHHQRYKYAWIQLYAHAYFEDKYDFGVSLENDYVYFGKAITNGTLNTSADIISSKPYAFNLSNPPFGSHKIKDLYEGLANDSTNSIQYNEFVGFILNYRQNNGKILKCVSELINNSVNEGYFEQLHFGNFYAIAVSFLTKSKEIEYDINYWNIGNNWPLNDGNHYLRKNNFINAGGPNKPWNFNELNFDFNLVADKKISQSDNIMNTILAIKYFSLIKEYNLDNYFDMPSDIEIIDSMVNFDFSVLKELNYSENLSFDTKPPKAHQQPYNQLINSRKWLLKRFILLTFKRTK